MRKDIYLGYAVVALVFSLFALPVSAGSYGQSITYGSDWGYSQPTPQGGSVQYAPGYGTRTVTPAGRGYITWDPLVAPRQDWIRWETQRKHHILPHIH